MGSVFVIFRFFLPTGKGRGRGTELGGKFLEGPADLEVTVRLPATCYSETLNDHPRYLELR